jgi:hypothetical protein
VSPRPLAGSRLRRVLALVPWIAEHPGAALEEIAARFGVSEAELEHDLELLPLCGLPPYTPDRLIEVEIVDGHVWIRFAEYFDRPLRLSAEEGLGLLTAGRALLAVPGSDEQGALARALDKLASALGAAEGLAVEVGEPAPTKGWRSTTTRSDGTRPRRVGSTCDPCSTRSGIGTRRHTAIRPRTSGCSDSTASGRFGRRVSASIPRPARSPISARASTTLAATIRA